MQGGGERNQALVFLNVGDVCGLFSHFFTMSFVVSLRCGVAACMVFFVWLLWSQMSPFGSIGFAF